MDMKLFSTVFVTIFLAELGDKTQLATLLYASEATSPKLTVFAAASAALVLAAGIGVAAGATLSRWLDPRWLQIAAGLAFVAIGIWTLASVWGGGGD
jgi:putative Ca2+/H+ antiporter (TMEM165/GDT1 family)